MGGISKIKKRTFKLSDKIKEEESPPRQQKDQFKQV